MSKQELAEKFWAEKTANENAQFEILRLKDRVDWFKRQMFGDKSERHVPDTDKSQLTLDLGQEPARQEEETKTELITYQRTVKTNRKEKPVRLPFPAHLRREVTIINPEGDLEGMVKIKNIITEFLEEKPGEIYVSQIVRGVYAYRNDPDKGVITPNLPAYVLPKFSVGVSMMALVIIRKYADHLPLYRQIEIYRRAGLILIDSTVGDWVRSGLNMLIPLLDLQEKLIFSSAYIEADETGIRVLDRNKKGTTHKGWYWQYQDPLRGLIWFDYQPGRDASGPNKRLDNFQGYLQTDGYKVYDRFENTPGIILLACWAHARRYYEQALKNDKARAEYVLGQIRLLYSIERFADRTGLSYQERRELRQENATPILTELKKWLSENLPQVSQQSAIGKAISYSLGRWNKLLVYLQKGELRIDNNLAENAIRPIALGRKNYLFAGSHESAKRGAMIYSLLATCKRHGINPYQYLKDVLARISSHPINQLEELLPHMWKPA